MDPKTDTPPQPVHKDNMKLGMAAGLAAFFMFAVMNVLAKLLSETHHVIEIGFYRNLIATLPFLFIIFAMGRRDILVIRQKPGGILIRAVVGTVSLIVTFSAFSMMPMADATAFLFTSSLFIPAMGFFFLGEQVGKYRWGAVLVGFIGVLVMLQPSGVVSGLGVTLALSAALMHATLQTILRHLGKFERPETITFYFVMIGTIVSALPLPFVAKPPTLAEIPLLFGVGLTGALAQWLLSIAYKNAPAAVVTVFNFSGIIWATLFGFVIWGDWPNNAIWIGGAIVIASNIFIVWRETLKRKMLDAEVEAKL